MPTYSIRYADTPFAKQTTPPVKDAVKKQHSWQITLERFADLEALVEEYGTISMQGFSGCIGGRSSWLVIEGQCPAHRVEKCHRCGTQLVLRAGDGRASVSCPTCHMSRSLESTGHPSQQDILQRALDHYWKIPQVMVLGECRACHKDTEVYGTIYLCSTCTFRVANDAVKAQPDQPDIKRQDNVIPCARCGVLNSAIYHMRWHDAQVCQMCIAQEVIANATEN